MTDDDPTWIEEKFVRCHGCGFKFAGGEVRSDLCGNCRPKSRPGKRVFSDPTAPPPRQDTGPRVYRTGAYQ